MSGLIWSFGIYFVFWHSIPSIKEQTIFIYGKAEKESIKNYFKKAFIILATFNYSINNNLLFI